MNAKLACILTLIAMSYALKAQNIPCCEHPNTIIDKEVERYLALKNFTANSMTSDYDLVYHRMEWIIDPAERFIDGKVTSYFRPLQDDFSTLHFDFSDELNIIRVDYHGTTLTADKIGNNIIAIDLPTQLSSGVLDSISITYDGVPPSSGFSSFNADVHNDVPIVWTLSQPYGARDWWPCKQNLSDKIDSIDVFVICPNGNKVASNGVLKSVNDNATHSTYHWSHRHPIPAYLIAIAVTNYEEFTQHVYLSSGDSIKILNYIYPESRSRAEADLVFIIPLMELYNDLFGLYPFADEKYGHAEFEFGGGMEHQTMSFMGGYSFELQAHELAHQWFGNKVTCASWQDIWINEGFATYLTGLGIEFLSDSIFWDGWKRGNIQGITNQPDGSVYVEDTSSVGSIFNGRLTYAKGGLTLHMIRWILGDETFFQACRQLLEDPQFSFGYINTDQFRMALERYTSVPFQEFFADWIYGEGHPSYEVLWEQKNDELLLVVHQETSHPSVDFFEMPIPIKVFHESGDTILRFNHVQNGQLFRTNFTKEIDSLQFDPDLWIISRDNVVKKDFISSTSQPFESIGTVAPNPVDDICHIYLYDNNQGRINLYNLQGDLISSIKIKSSSVQLSFQTYVPGTYILEFLDEKNRSFSTKIVKY